MGSCYEYLDLIINPVLALAPSDMELFQGWTKATEWLGSTGKIKGQLVKASVTKLRLNMLSFTHYGPDTYIPPNQLRTLGMLHMPIKSHQSTHVQFSPFAPLPLLLPTCWQSRDFIKNMSCHANTSALAAVGVIKKKNGMTQCLSTLFRQNREIQS